MLSSNNNIKIFLELVRAGLWEKDVRLLPFGDVDFSEVQKLAEEQAVVGLVAAGLEHVTDVKLPKEEVFPFIGQALQLEQQNMEMNKFIVSLVKKMRDANIYSVLVKGQGIAQCYERPLWRSSGDVDLYLSESSYMAARSFLSAIASHVDDENEKMKHLGMTIGSWVVELHGAMYTELSSEINKGLDDVHSCIFNKGEVRCWDNSGVPVFLPSPDNDIIIVFTHILQHFFIEGIGLKQICDWCRLLWTYRDAIDKDLLRNRLKKMGLYRIWEVFACLAVNELGMPEGAMPFYTKGKHGSKSKKLMARVIESGNFGHNKDLSYRTRYSGMTYIIVAAWRRLKDFASLIPVFPLDAPRFYVTYVLGKVK